MIDVVIPDQNVNVHEPECIIESPFVCNHPNVAQGTSPNQQTTAVQDTVCMKAESNCMPAMSASSTASGDAAVAAAAETGPDTLDNIESKHSEKLPVFKDHVENDDTKHIVLDSTTTQSSVVDIATKTCNLACVNEDEDEDCSCTTTSSRSPTPVHFEITAKGVKVISDRDSFL